MSKPITVDKIRYVFEDKKTGLPKKECLKTSIELLKIIGIDVKKLTKEERYYNIQFMGALIKHLRDMYRDHHCNFISIKKQGIRYVLHGFPENKDFIQNNLKRIENRKASIIEIAKKVKQLTNEQLELFDNISLEKSNYK